MTGFQHAGFVAEHFLGSIASGFGEFWIDVLDDAVGVGDEDHGRAGLDGLRHLAQALPGYLQLDDIPLDPFHVPLYGIGHLIERQRDFADFVPGAESNALFILPLGKTAAG